MKRFLVLFILLTGVSVSGAAENLSGPPASAQEVAVLRAQLEQSHHFDDLIINTVWGAIGLLGLVSALLVGGNYFGSRRNHEQDKKQLEEEIQKAITSAVSITKAALSKEIEERFSRYEKRSSSQLAKLQLDLLEAQHDGWSGVPENAFDTTLEMLELLLAQKDPAGLDRAVETLRKDAEAVARNQETGIVIFSTNSAARALDALSKLAGSSAELAQDIRPMITRLRKI